MQSSHCFKQMSSLNAFLEEVSTPTYLQRVMSADITDEPGLERELHALAGDSGGACTFYTPIKVLWCCSRTFPVENITTDPSDHS
jgi:hypothetical protein